MDLVTYLAEAIDQYNQSLDKGSTAEQEVNEKCAKDVQFALCSNGSTLELGCGHGLPACVVLREVIQGRSRDKSRTHVAGNQCRKSGKSEGPIVMFSDYNDFVLQDVTIPNAVVNLCQISEKNTDVQLQSLLNSYARFVGGDWMHLSHELLLKGTRLNVCEDDDPTCVGRFDLILAAETMYTTSCVADTVTLLLRHLKLNSGVALIATKRYSYAAAV